MGNGLSLLVPLIVVMLLVVFTVQVVSVWRSERNRKFFYVLLLGVEFAWFSVLGWLFTLVGAALAWEIGMEGVLFALMLATLVLLYRHRHDPDPDEP